MKKAVKGLIIAASVASVIGIGAVSFAAWSGDDSKSVEVTGATGSIKTIGALTVTPADGTFTQEAESDPIVMNALYPVDQNKDGGSHLTYWEFTLTTTGVTGEATVTFGLKGDLDTKDGETAALYWTATQPTDSTVAVEANKLTADTAATLTGVESGDTIYVYMVASGTEAMKADISLTFSADAA